MQANDRRTATNGEATVKIELSREHAQVLHGMLAYEEQTAETADGAQTYAAMKARIGFALEEAGDA